MAVSKHTCKDAPGANPFFLKLFGNSRVSEERERAWHDTVRHAGTGSPPLRFPAYEHLYLLNVYAQKMVELLEDLGGKFSINREPMLYRQSLIQYVRASASQDIVDFMSGVELTEAWLFENQRRKEENSLRNPEDVYYSVRHRETERAQQGLPPRVRFLDEPQVTKSPTARKTRAGKSK
jgi:hypothetical protein